MASTSRDDQKAIRRALLADAALPAFFRAVLAVLTILTSLARIGTSASCSEETAGRSLTEEKDGQQHLRKHNEES